MFVAVMEWITILDMTAKLILAVILGGVVGYERETHGRPAGFRTHILVCLGSTIFTIVSISYRGYGSDPSRISAQIVTGIGFLGAGTIIRQGSAIRGLTTAASLWTVAAIGIAVGTGGSLIVLAIIATAVVFATLGVINKIEHKLIPARRVRDLIVTARGPQDMVCKIIDAVISTGTEVLGTRMEPTEEEGVRLYRLRLRFPPHADARAVTDNLGRLSGVTGIEWD